ncbi:hypothetical protein KAI04_00810 [Candidatus Pacearchaeota archaeon]|nr:hypothetical protein [Candidatus Pacearchaeota archaeon]
MIINKEYLEEFCEHHNIFTEKTISEEKISKLNYYFGVDIFYLSSIKNLPELEKIINKHSQSPIEANEDLNHEAILFYKKFN